MYLIYDDGCYGHHRYGPVQTVLHSAENPIIIQKLSSEGLAQLAADLLILPQELPEHQVTSLAQFLARYGRSRLGRRFDRLVARHVVERLEAARFLVVRYGQ